MGALFQKKFFLQAPEAAAQNPTPGYLRVQTEFKRGELAVMSQIPLHALFLKAS